MAEVEEPEPDELYRTAPTVEVLAAVLAQRRAAGRREAILLNKVEETRRPRSKDMQDEAHDELGRWLRGWRDNG